MYIEITLFKKLYYLQLGREIGQHWCVYLISSGRIWIDDNNEVEYATLYGIFKKQY